MALVPGFAWRASGSRHCALALVEPDPVREARQAKKKTSITTIRMTQHTVTDARARSCCYMALKSLQRPPVDGWRYGRWKQTGPAAEEVPIILLTKKMCFSALSE